MSRRQSECRLAVSQSIRVCRENNIKSLRLDKDRVLSASEFNLVFSVSIKLMNLSQTKVLEI